MKKYLFVLLSILLINNSFLLSQDLKKFEIKKQKKPSTAGTLLIDHPKMAAIVIWSSITNLHFESNMNGIVSDLSQPQDGKYILVLKPTTKQIITVKAPGFIAGKIRLSKLKQKEFVYYQVESVQKPLNPDRGKIILRSMPTKAQFRFSGFDMKGTTPYHSPELATGTYKIIVSKDKYEPSEIIIPLAKGEVKQETIVLTPKFGFLKVKTTAGVSLSVDGQNITSSYNSVELPVGMHTALLEKKYYDSYEDVIDIKPGETFIINEELKKQVGLLSVSSQPTGADIYLNGSHIGKTPIIERETGAGDCTIRIKLKGYREEKKQLVVSKNKNEKIFLILAKDGIIRITGTVGANIKINNKNYGTLPSRDIVLNQGRYTIQITKLGYIPEEKSISLGSEEIALNFNLRNLDEAFKLYSMSSFDDKPKIYNTFLLKPIALIYPTGIAIKAPLFMKYSALLDANIIKEKLNCGYMGYSLLGNSMYSTENFLILDIISLNFGWLWRTKNHKNRFIFDIDFGLKALFDFSKERVKSTGKEITFAYGFANDDSSAMGPLHFAPIDISISYEKQIIGNSLFVLQIGLWWFKSIKPFAAENSIGNWYYQDDIDDWRHHSGEYPQPIYDSSLPDEPIYNEWKIYLGMGIKFSLANSIKLKPLKMLSK